MQRIIKRQINRGLIQTGEALGFSMLIDKFVRKEERFLYGCKDHE